MNKVMPFGIFILTLLGCNPTVKEWGNKVTVLGQMRDVMWNGQLGGNIDLDTITTRLNLYGLGPVEYLRGELLIVNGKSYRSTVTSDTTMRVDETYVAKAPFFAYANIPQWNEYRLPDSIQMVAQLERFIENVNRDSGPLLFRLSGIIDHATVHIVNLPPGSSVRSPEDSHKGQRNYELQDEPVEIVGFFSKQHKGIFTHHDTFLHMHLITADSKKMGHLDVIQFRPGEMKLYLPSSL